jgi:sterol desaturase/sphingolipid hydroxylase (fatty acid hydroxylase superfamily)
LYNPAMSLPAAVASFREDYRARHIGPRYSGVAHLLFTSLGSLAVIVLAAANVRAPRPLELLTVPVTFLFANYVEYRGHQGPMHRRRRGLSLLFERHTRQHHRYFTQDAMSYEGTRDFKMVLFPPVMLLFFLGVVAVPVGTALFWLSSRNVALLYVATAMGYFLAYEWLHFCHHLPPDTPLARLGVLRRLRAHHQAHHDPARMDSWNFNISFPICDRLLGTRWSAPDAGAQPSSRSR